MLVFGLLFSFLRSETTSTQHQHSSDKTDKEAETSGDCEVNEWCAGKCLTAGSDDDDDGDGEGAELWNLLVSMV